MARGALPQAIKDFERGLALLKALPSGAKRDALELQTLGPLGMAYIAVRGYAAPEVGPVFVRARQLSERIGQPPQVFAVFWGNFVWHAARGDGFSMDLAREAIGLAERFDDPGIWMEALFLLGATLFYRGNFVGANVQFEKALSLYDDRERARLALSSASATRRNQSRKRGRNPNRDRAGLCDVSRHRDSFQGCWGATRQTPGRSVAVTHKGS